MHQGRKLKIGLSLLLLSISSMVFAEVVPSTAKNKFSFHLSPLFMQPGSDNLKYAVFVSGNQPYYQSWHNQEINPGYTPGFEMGINYLFKETSYDGSIDWVYLNTNDACSKQASQNIDIVTVEFIGPPYDVGPAVFGIKRASGKANFDFNNVNLNIGKRFEYKHGVRARIFGGLSLINLNQTVTALFSDYRGSPPIATQAYALPADPNFYFQTQNISKYFGAGPDVGIDVQYQHHSGFGVTGRFLGMLTAGRISVSDNFTSASTRLMNLGIPTSYQSITAPNATQVVPGFDSKLGLFYNHIWKNSLDLTLELGYRFAYYINAISEIYPTTLVQAGLNETIPEFATGTMAINSTGAKFSSFSMQGPYLNITIGLA